jgi:hypothetical protein
MRNLLAGLSALLILVGALGWFRGYYTIGTLPADAGRFAFRVEVDGIKMGGDVMDVLRYAQRKFSADKEKDREEKDEKPGKEK